MATPRRDSVGREDIEDGAWSAGRREKEKLLGNGGEKAEEGGVSKEMAMTFLLVWMVK